MTGPTEPTELRPSVVIGGQDSMAQVKTVILAGGMGTRLRPYTSVLPKPLLPLGDRSILELLMRKLGRHGFTDITLSVGHLSHLIEAVLGDGSERRLDITYVREDMPLGTAGSLRLVPDLGDTFLMLNGDLVTTLDFAELVRYHRAQNNILTIAMRQRKVHTEYGVLRVRADSEDGQRIVGYEEKPVLDFLVSMGVYVVEPEALAYIPETGYFDFPDLVVRLLEAEARVGGFEYSGLWLDVGRHEDYEQAITFWEEGKLDALFDGETGPSASTAASPAS